MKTINIKNDFTKNPGLRHSNISEFSGEDFYHTILNSLFYQALKSKEKLIVILDGVEGYAPSFLDEAFGNLVYDFSLEKVKKILSIISEDEPYWKTMIENDTYINWEKRRKDKQVPKKTKSHNDWYKLDNNNIVLSN